MTIDDRKPYLSLATRRRDGRMVSTPVWFAELDDAWYVFSAGDSGKVKRLRNFSDVMIAPCDVRGRLLGDTHPSSAVLVDDPVECRAAYAALRRKYGWQMSLLDLLSRLGGKINQRQLIRINKF